MAEALFNDANTGGGKFRAYSAGSLPTGRVNPNAIAQLNRAGIAVPELRSKSWDEFAVANAPQMDFIITVCDQAAGETCPIWPGQPTTAHWGLPDPAAATGAQDMIDAAFMAAFDILKRRVQAFAALNLAALSAAEIKHQLTEIGRL